MVFDKVKKTGKINNKTKNITKRFPSVKYKKGPFSKSEILLVESALKFVLIQEGMYFSEENGRKIFPLEKKRLPKNFWGKVAYYVPSRSVESIYDHVRRRLSSENYKGKWSTSDLSKLEELVKIFGKSWTKIGGILNRLPGACYDKWRDALKNGNKRQKGKWSQEERCKLIQFVTYQTNHEVIQKIGNEKIIKWTFLAERIGTRSYLQCRNEWTRFFSPGSKLKLTIEDSFSLLKTIASSKFSDETEIKWNNILKGIPSHKTYNKWRSLCKRFTRKSFSKNGIPLPLKKAVQLIIENLVKRRNKKALLK